MSGVPLDGGTVTGVSAGVANALAQARAFGYLGPGPLQTHVDHARGFFDTLVSAGLAADGHTRFRAVDLGSGGGVPGLLLAEWWPDSRWEVVDSNQRRMQTLIAVAADLQIDDRLTVHLARAEDAGRDPTLRGHCDVVVARGFATPAVTAECAAGFLAPGGILVVSDPPNGTDRWSDRGLAVLGLRRLPTVPGSYHFFAAVQDRLTPAKYPRAVGVPGKTPLF